MRILSAQSLDEAHYNVTGGKGFKYGLKRIVRITLSPVLGGEGRVRGRWGERRSAIPAPPLTPEYEGEGAGGRIASIQCCNRWRIAERGTY